MKGAVRRWALGAGLSLVLLQLWLSSEFVALRPGVAAPAGELAKIDGASPSSGRLLFTTVTASRANLFEALRSFLDPGVEIAPRRERIPEAARWDEYSALLERLMAETKKVAAAIAFREAGHRVSVASAAVVDLVLEDGPFGGAVAPGSVLVSVNGVSVHTEEAAYDALRAAASQGTVRLAIHPAEGGAVRTVEAPAGKAGRGPDGRYPYGLVLRTSYTVDPPVPLLPGTARASGSSAGLMLALELLDQLTGGSLSGGGLVAGTGAVRLDGAVLPVDGVRQKVIAAEKSGATHFILPRANVTEALAAATSVELVPVDTFSQAVEALRRLRGEE